MPRQHTPIISVASCKAQNSAPKESRGIAQERERRRKCLPRTTRRSAIPAAAPWPHCCHHGAARHPPDAIPVSFAGSARVSLAGLLFRMQKDQRSHKAALSADPMYVCHLHRPAQRNTHAPPNSAATREATAWAAHKKISACSRHTPSLAICKTSINRSDAHTHKHTDTLLTISG